MTLRDFPDFTIWPGHAEGLNMIRYSDCVIYYYYAIIWHELLFIVRTITPHSSASSVNSYLFIFAIIFSLYDTISTALCVNANGHEYELSALLKWTICNFGLVGLIGVKMGVTLVALAAV
jgi:hypothetical protein